MAEGLGGRAPVKPNKITITTSDNQQSVLWMGSFGQLEVNKLTILDNDKLYFTTSVVVKNVGSAALREFFCKRTFLSFCSTHPLAYLLSYHENCKTVQMQERWTLTKNCSTMARTPR